jgi:hypothetical protein
MRYKAALGSTWGSFAALTCFVFSASAGFCQLAEVTPSPPGGLPRLMNVSEAGPDYAASSVWIWHGSSYSAIWGNGAVSQLTVASGDSGDLRLKRQDSAGPVAGLTAIYTGKWDGKAFSDGKVMATLKGGTTQLIWTATPALTPVFRNPEQGPHTFVNWYPAQLTAYALYNSKGTFNSSIGVEVDDCRLRGEPPMNPGESRAFTPKYYLAPVADAKGVTYPQAVPLAAIYADGTTFGDANVLKLILARRQAMVEPLTSMGATMCAMGQQAASLAAISAALNKQHADEDARSLAGKEERDLAYSYVQKSLISRTNNHLKPSQAVKRTWDQLNKLRSDLVADPVKDAAGEPVIPPVTPLVCHLP